MAGDWSVLYSDGAPTDAIRLGQLLVDESEADPVDMLKICTDLSPVTYTSIGGITTPVEITSGALRYVGGTTLGAAATDITVSGLDLATDEDYVVYLVTKNATGSTTFPSLYYNADTTATNYHVSLSTVNNTTLAGQRANDAILGGFLTTENYFARLEIRRDVDGNPRALYSVNRGPGSAGILITGMHIRNNTANVTSLTFRSSVALAFASGSYVKVFKVVTGSTVLASLGAGVTTHADLDGLSSDDHPQYALVASDETISGVYTFTGVDANGYAMRITGVAPAIQFFETDADADEGGWDIVAASTGGDGTLRFRWNTDAGADTDWLRVTRTSSAVSTIAFSGSTLSSSGTILSTKSSAAGAPAIRMESTSPVLQWYDTDAASDEKLWRVHAAGTQMLFDTRTDADGAGANWMAATRSGTTVTAAGINATTVNLQSGGTTKFQINGSGVAFWGQTPAARPDYTVTNPTTDRALNVTADTLAQGLAVLGTVIADLIAIGLFQ